MEGIVEKVSKLPPELQKEVEDYIDYLLERHVSPIEHPIVSKIVPSEGPSLLSKPVLLSEEIPFRQDAENLSEFSNPFALNPDENLPERITEVARRRDRDNPVEEKDLLDWID